MAQAFDPLAKAYDAAFTDTLIGQRLRQRVHTRLLTRFAEGDRVLELGCGTGEDALFLAQRGTHVTATDVSENMLEITRAKTAHTGLVAVERLDLRRVSLFPNPLPIPHVDTAEHGKGEKSPVGASYVSPSQQPPTSNDLQFDGVLSNFGAVNVLEDWRPLAHWLAERVKPGGVVALGIMGRLCAWELLWHSAHLDFKTAGRRLSGKSSFQGDEASTPIAIYYPTIGRIKRDFAPQFGVKHVEGLGVFLPPSDAFGVVEKRPCLMKMLTMLERRFAKVPPFAHVADHFWIEFEREK